MIFSLTLIFVFTGAISCSGSRGPYNLVIVVSDALRYDVLGCYGGSARTPNIDWLAKNGVLFEKAYSPTPRTLPSAVSMFTGNHSTTYPSEEELGKIIKFFVPDREELFAETLTAAGYETVSHVENDNASLSQNMQGFGPFQDAKSLTADEILDIKNSTGFNPRNKKYHKMTGLLHFLLTVSPGTNFCAVKWILDPHSPYSPPQFFKNQIEVDPDRLSHPPALYARSHFGSRWIKKRMVGRDFSPYEIAYVKELYRKEVESVDERLGYVLAALRKNRLLETTYVIFTSDHGESFGEHNRFGHGHSYIEELLHIPLIVYGPRLDPGRRVQDRVSLLGLIPTIMDLLGKTPAEKVQGESFAPLLRGKHLEAGSLFFVGVNLRASSRDAMIADGYKLVTSKNKSDPALFNLNSDPTESRNLARKEPHIMKRLLARILAIRKGNRDRLESNIKLGKHLNRLGDEDRQKILEHLRTLGYID